ncbi:hypothetical protein CPB84DRAFT_1723940 [Gymnopilus junonius]|uniref:BRCA2 OB1 domain-containing protein n=1 Tax=Gymnopilus junonius TaxID=109634 RepID=A0A9P5TRU5_GYMJU|nr:hypothetical protein CPB84DRAFT_1723940 [Gymnopilus junonius]
MRRSPSSSPARKRQRLSSPTYDGQVEDLTEAQFAEIDAIEERLSQKANLLTRGAQPLSDDQEATDSSRISDPVGQIDWSSSQSREPSSPNRALHFTSEKVANIRDDPENPFTNGFSSAAKLQAVNFTPPMIGFASASKILVDHKNYERSPSPEVPPPEPDLDSWFNPVPIDTPATAFTSSASFLSSGSVVAGFSTASKKGLIMPSKEALVKAKAKISAWQQEDDTGLDNSNDENSFMSSSSNVAQKPDTFIGFKTASGSFAPSSIRPALQELGNNMRTPVTPSPDFSRPSLPGFTKANSSVQSPSLHRPGQFKPPTFKQPHTPTTGTTFSSPLNLNRQPLSLNFTSAASTHPLAAPPINATQQASTSSSALTTPLRSKGQKGPIKSTPTPFKTPFKPGMRPGEPGRLKLGESSTPLRIAVTTPIPTPAKTNETWVARPMPTLNQRKEFFNLKPNFERKSLASSRLAPQQHTAEELEYMGINVSMLNQLTPETALYYSFHTTSPEPVSSTPSPSSPILGPAEALRELLARGCSLATKPWVDNHWCHILWKLAGMVGLDPEKEANASEKRWCWTEVMRQLLYRYERELNCGIRPTLRKIATQDAPAAFPMVLCVSNIFWSERGVTEDGLPIEPHPELEVTDGWYRLRAQVDLPMARAVRKGVLRVGRKIGFAGARLSTERKEPTEILEAYNSTKLVFSGNSSHLMPWHSKLGFTRGPCISTLHSLTHDGGVVAALDFVITKVRPFQPNRVKREEGPLTTVDHQLHPIAYVEFFESEDGKSKRREGPRNAAEENKINEQWKRRYEMEASKLRAEFDKKYNRYNEYIDRLERKAGGKFRPGEEDSPPDDIDTLYDEMEYPDSAGRVIARVSSTDAGWLAMHIRKQSEAARERIGEEIEKEMKTICPPRDVRSFRMLIVQDARTLRRPGTRNAQLTVWDVLGLTLEEGSQAGSFEVGQRFLVTNLMPVQASAWMGCCEPNSEVFLSTRRDTRWTRVKANAQEDASCRFIFIDHSLCF